jgi:hypothetical protein
MASIVVTNHLLLRMQQRGIRNNIVENLVKYGEVRKSRHGIDSIVFTKKSLEEIKSECGYDAYKKCERQKNTYLIVSDDGVAVTVAHSYRHSIH